MEQTPVPGASDPEIAQLLRNLELSPDSVQVIAVVKSRPKRSLEPAFTPRPPPLCPGAVFGTLALLQAHQELGDAYLGLSEFSKSCEVLAKTHQKTLVSLRDSLWGREQDFLIQLNCIRKVA